MLKICLCDDNKTAICQYAQWLDNIARKHKMQVQISCFYSGETLLEQYSIAPNEVDIIYLDILMRKTDGLETAYQLRRYGCDAQIIFLTSFAEYVFQSFDVSPINYLVKEDTDIARFEEVFLKAAGRIAERVEEQFAFEFDGKANYIPYSEIAYFEIYKGCVMIYCGNGMQAKFYASMEQLVSQLARHNFVRTHRSYLVNLLYVSSFGAHTVVLKTGASVPVGSTYSPKLKEAFGAYLTHHHIYKHNADQQGEMA